MSSASTLSSYLPKRESFQNALSHYVPSIDIFSCLDVRMGNNKDERYSSESDDNWKRTSSLPDIALQRFSHFSATTHSFLFSDVNHKPCSCSGLIGKCNYDNSDCNPTEYFHAVKNTHENAPSCCVEPHILKGYVLAHQPWRYYLRVLWTPNNETLNVWTHLIPSIYFMFLLYSYFQTVDLYHAWPLFLVTLSAITMTLFSSIAHMFHCRSAYHHCAWLMLDYFGISLYAFSSITAHYFASAEPSYYARIGCLNLPVFMIINNIGFYCCCYSKTCRQGSTHHRKYKVWSTSAGYLYGLIPLAHRWMTRTDADPAMFYHLLQFIFMFLSPFVYSLDIPQRFWPGRFDIIGHSHQFFHIFSALSCYFDIQAIHHDLTNGHWDQLNSQPYYPTFPVLVVACILMIAGCALTARRFLTEFRISFKDEIAGLYNTRSLSCCTFDIISNKEKKAE